MFRSFEAYEILSSSPSFDEERYSHLIELPPFESSLSVHDFLKSINIIYMAPGMLVTYHYRQIHLISLFQTLF